MVRDDKDDQKLKEQFVQHQHTDDIGMFDFGIFDFERALRNSRESFNEVRKLLPTQYRFRIVNAHGQDILDQSNVGFTDAQNCSTNNRHDMHQSYDLHQSDDNMRVECGEPVQDNYYSNRNDTDAQLVCFH